MLKSGRYLAEKDKWDGYKIVIAVKETTKSYIFDLLTYESCYSPAQIDMLFAKTKKVRICKEKSQHAIWIWSDRDFTLYPYRAGIPFYFKLMEDESNG